MALERADWESDAHVTALDDADIIYFTGGNPWYLLQTIRDTPLLAAILQRGSDGAILAGSSAGAMVLGGWMRERTGGWTQGLGVLPGIAVVPHFRATGRIEASALRSNLPDDVTVLGIGEATGCVAADGNHRWEVVGENAVQVIEPTALRDYRNGQSFIH
jgi:cyanophycinase